MAEIFSDNIKREGQTKGLFRTALAGEGGTLTEAFRRLGDIDNSLCPADIYPERKLMAARLPIPDGEGDGLWELINVRDEIFVVVTDCRYTETRAERVPSEEFVEFHFTLVGPVQLEALGTDQLDLRDPLMIICKQGPGADYTVWCEPGPRRLISIYIKKDFLTESLGLQAIQSTSILWEILQNRPDQIACYQLPIQVDITDIIRQLMNLPYSGRQRLLYAEAKINELLCLCLEKLTGASDSDPVMDMFTNRELEMFEEARRILTSNFSPIPTISYLARVVGTNTSKLKKGFKLIYGCTIFEFGQQLRMKHAMHLLADEKLTVGAVAEMVGYQHQASFATAFKEYYGFLPKEARKLTNQN